MKSNMNGNDNPMKRFLMKTMVFFLLLFLLLVLGILLPPTPRASKSLLFAKIQKDSLLLHVPSPRIIFVGGSNLSFGLNSRMIRDSLGLNPINTSIQASIGLIYMMDNTLPYVQPGDVVVVATEYSQFFDTEAYGSEELLRTVVDVAPGEWNKLSRKQWINVLPYIAKASFSRFNPREYIETEESDIYGVNSFNEYGDVYKHYDLEQRAFLPYNAIKGSFNHSVLNALCAFKDQVSAKGATFLFTYPGLQAATFNNSRGQIGLIGDELKKNNIQALGTPERFIMPDSLMFNTPYHLTKPGVDFRTRLFIEDFKEYQRSLK